MFMKAFFWFMDFVLSLLVYFMLSHRSIFYRQIGGEIVISYSLGLLPILGAYLIQAGDISRTVYLAALPSCGRYGFMGLD